MANGRLQGEDELHAENYLLEMLHSYAKTRLKSTSQKLNFVMATTILFGKSYETALFRKPPEVSRNTLTFIPIGNPLLNNGPLKNDNLVYFGSFFIKIKMADILNFQ